MKEPWKNRKLLQPWRRRNWTPDLTDKKEVKKVSNLHVGWMVWWRSILPYMVFVSLVGWGTKDSIGLGVGILSLPVLFFLFDRAGRVVAQKKYSVNIITFANITQIGPISVPISAIGWGIWWRTTLLSIPMVMVSLILFSISASGIIGFIYFSITVFLQTLIVGWATNRVISRSFKLSFVTTKASGKVKRKKES